MTSERDGIGHFFWLSLFISESTIIMTSSLKLTDGSQPRMERAFDGSEINKSTFQGSEWPEPTLRRLERRPEQAMSDSNRRAFNRGNVAVRNITISLLEVDPVTISQFPFHHQIAMDAVAEPSANSEIVGIGLRNTQVIDKYANFDALLCK